LVQCMFSMSPAHTGTWRKRRRLYFDRVLVLNHPPAWLRNASRDSCKLARSGGPGLMVNPLPGVVKVYPMVALI